MANVTQLFCLDLFYKIMLALSLSFWILSIHVTPHSENLCLVHFILMLCLNLFQLALTVIPREVPGTSSAATINSDFYNDPITVTFDEGEDFKLVDIPIRDDNIEEMGLESFVVRIKSVRQDTDDGNIGSEATIDNDNRETIVYIRDDDGECN